MRRRPSRTAGCPCGAVPACRTRCPSARGRRPSPDAWHDPSLRGPPRGWRPRRSRCPAAQDDRTQRQPRAPFEAHGLYACERRPLTTYPTPRRPMKAADESHMRHALHRGDSLSQRAPARERHGVRGRRDVDHCGGRCDRGSRRSRCSGPWLPVDTASGAGRHGVRVCPRWAPAGVPREALRSATVRARPKPVLWTGVYRTMPSPASSPSAPRTRPACPEPDRSTSDTEEPKRSPLSSSRGFPGVLVEGEGSARRQTGGAALEQGGLAGVEPFDAVAGEVFARSADKRVRMAVGVVVADRDGGAEGVTGPVGAGHADGVLVDDLAPCGPEPGRRPGDHGDLTARPAAGLGGTGLPDHEVVVAVAVDVARGDRPGTPHRDDSRRGQSRRRAREPHHAPDAVGATVDEGDVREAVPVEVAGRGVESRVRSGAPSSAPDLVAPPVSRTFQVPPRPAPAANTSALRSPSKSPTATAEPSRAPVAGTPEVV